MSLIAVLCRCLVLLVLLLAGASLKVDPAHAAARVHADFQAAWRQAVAYGTFAEVY